MNENLPMEVTVRVNSTNGTTMLNAFEEICRSLKSFEFPRGTVETEFWKMEVLDRNLGLLDNDR